MVMMLFLLVPGAAASSSKGGEIDLQEILWGHIKDSYEWHVTSIGDKHIIINLPVFVKTSKGWYTGWAEDFAEGAVGGRSNTQAIVLVKITQTCSLQRRETTNVVSLSCRRMARKCVLSISL